MNKKLLTIISAVLCTGVLCGTVLASNLSKTEAVTSQDNEYNEISEALNNSNTLRGYLSPKVDVASADVDEENTELNVQNANMSQAAEPEDIRLKLYTVNIDDETQSIYQQLADENDMWIVVKDNGENIGYSFLKKGAALSEVEKKVNELNVPETTKSRMLAKAAAREGKWYVAYVSKYKDQQASRDFVSESHINSLLEADNITSIADKKYVYIQNNDTLAVLVRTADNEYIIPFAGGSSEFENNRIYTTQELKANVISE